MSTVKKKKKILGLCSTGKTGSRVMQRLTQLNWPVRAGSRSADPAFDWQDQTTWTPALQGIHAVYISYHPDLAVPGTTDIIRSFTATALKNGVQQLVLLSGRGEPEARDCEQIVMEAGMDWTILRSSWFSQNFSEGFFVEPIVAGYVELPAPNIAEPFIDVDDIADAAVAALTEEGHHGKLYELTGPRLLTFPEAIQEIATATGRKIQYRQISIQQYTALLTGYNVPAEYISLVTYLFTEILDGRNAHLNDGVQQALGRKATDFRECVQKTAATGVWDQR
jgi:uncharacterized protein YbjT (DUF2867 family)